MKLAVVVFGLAVAACGGAPSGGDDHQADDSSGGDDTEELAARVTVQLVEQRVAEPEFRNGSATVSVAPFDGRTFPICGEQILFEGGGCRLTRYEMPTCDLSCGANELCIVDVKNDCQATCREVCTLPCAQGTYCLPGDESCRPIEQFEGAGDVTIAGLTAPLTLPAPDYPFTPLMGAVYAGGEVRATARGATTVGIDAFEVALAPPPAVIATPPLSSLTKDDFTGDLPLSWAAEGDEMELSLFVYSPTSGASGLCHMPDSGSFTIPGGLFDAFPADTNVVRIDLRRIREASTQTSGFGFYLGLDIPAHADAVLRLISLETWTVSFL